MQKLDSVDRRIEKIKRRTYLKYSGATGVAVAATSVVVATTGASSPYVSKQSHKYNIC
jgi:hypothetical protein